MRTRTIPALATAMCAIALGASTAAAVVPTIHVANNGVDGPACGTETAPCRTINEGLDRLPRGGNLLVHPGIYGDVDDDGVASGSGEDEAAPTVQDMFVINRKIKVKSTAGPASTVIRCPEAGPYRVRIQNATAQFGDKVSGFTLLDCSVVVIGGTQSPSVAGNRIIATTNGDPGILVETGVNVQILNNHVIGHQRGILVTLATDTLLKGNVAVGNRIGIEEDASGTVLNGNIVVGNVERGLFLLGNASPLPLVVERNSIIGNGTGNGDDGGIVYFNNAAAMVITNNNIYGNDAPAQNCGITDESDPGGPTLVATGNFWGAPTGPGPNPADVVCSPFPVDTSDFLDKEVSAKPKAMK
jgi:parallel beta-helix repeat protein